MGKIIMSGIVSKLTAPVTGEPIGNLTIGDSVYLNIAGVLTEFIIVNQGIPVNATDHYDTSCNGTWLLMKDIYTSMAMVSSESEVAYNNTNVHNYLTNEFFGLLGEKEQSAVKTVKVPYVAGTEPTANAQKYGANGLSVKFFCLDKLEVGAINVASTMGISYGGKLDYFLSSGTDGNAERRIANLNGTATAWWLRDQASLKDVGYSYHYIVTAAGSVASNSSDSASRGIRPACIVSTDTRITINNDGINVFV